MTRNGRYIPDENLAKRFPISPRYIIRQSFWWIVGVIGLSWAVISLSIAQNGDSEPEFQWLQDVYNVAFGVLAGLFVLAAARVLYAYLYRLTYYYGIEGRHFVISKGVLLKERRSCPINHITDVFIGRSFRDFVFRLNYLEIRTPARDPEQSGRIEGLTEEVAIKLQDYLLDILEETENSLTDYLHAA